MNRFFTLLMSLMMVQLSFAQLTVDNLNPYDTPDYLITDVLLGGGITANNFNWLAGPDNIGFFDGLNSNIGFDNGIVLSTGGLNLVGNGGVMTGVLATTGEPDLELALSNIGMDGLSVNNVTILEFDFVAQSEEMSFRYVFGSSEYTSYTCSSFNDIFGFFLSGPGIAGAYSNGAENIALVPGTNTPVGVNTINAGELIDDPDCNDIDPNFESYNIYWIDNDYIDDGWQGVNEPLAPENTVLGLTGFTMPLTASYNGLQCGETYHIKLAIADCMDQILNSAVFLEAGSFISPTVELTNNVGSNSDYIEVGCGETVIITAEPSEPGNYTYNWSNGATTESIEVGTGIYSVEVTSDINCAIFSDEIEVVVANSVDLDLGPDISVCDGLETTLTIENLEGEPPFTYSWSTGETTESISVPAGIYVLDILDANNCPAQDQVIVSYVDRPTVELSGGGSLCTGSSVGAPLDFEFTGTPPFLVTYGNGLQQFTTTTANYNTTESLTSEGNYQIISIEDLNCEGTYSGSAVVIEYPLPTSKIDGGGVICEGDSVLVDILVSGELPYDLYLSNGNYVNPHLQLDTYEYSIYLHNSADYSITEIVDANGCRSIQNDGNANVIWKEPIDPQILTSIDTIVCPIHNPIQLEVLSPGGSWLGNGLDYSGMFTPIHAGVGDHWISYSFPNNCNETDSILIEVACDMQLFIPNTFTPDNNGDNEVWYIHGINVLSFDLQLFNRWGKEIFTTQEITDYWTGYYKGSTVPTGTYSYLIKAYGKDGQFVTKTGVVNVLR